MGKDLHKKTNYEKKGNFNKSRAKPGAKKFIEDCCFRLGLVIRVSNHDATSQFITNHMKKTWIRSSNTPEVLRSNAKLGTPKWEPALEFEESAEDTFITRLNEKHELKHKMDYDACIKIKETHEQNLHKACAEL